MKCFYHGDVDAVAICKWCGHGVCRDCCADTNGSAACRNRCEADVTALNDMIQRNKTSFHKASSAYTRNGIFITVIGALFAGIGSYTWTPERPQYFLTMLGVLFVFYGISQFNLARRFRAK